MEDELKKIIQDSDLSPQQKKEWERVINYLTQEDITNIVGLIRSDSKHLYFLTENLEEKQVLFKTQNKELSGQLLEKEKKYLAEEI